MKLVKSAARTSLIFFMILLGTISYISYRGLVELIYPRERFVDGRAQSEIAVELRAGILKNHNAQEVRFKSTGDIELSGIWISRPNAKGNLLLCHGYRCCKEVMYSFIDIYENFNVLLFDFRAHGQSGGTITTIGNRESEDVLAAAKFLRSLEDNLPLVILGVSMGGAATLKAIEEEPHLCDAVIIDSSYKDLRVEIEHIFENKSGLPRFPFLYIMELMGNYIAQCTVPNVKPAEYLKRIKVPVFIVQSCVDDVIPPQDALALYQASLESKQKVKLWIAPPARHGYAHYDYPTLYKEKTKKFLMQALHGLRGIWQRKSSVVA